jgi:hypothetical protein
VRQLINEALERLREKTALLGDAEVA